MAVRFGLRPARAYLDGDAYEVADPDSECLLLAVKQTFDERDAISLNDPERKSLN
jgi:hypothetical protein